MAQSSNINTPKGSVNNSPNKMNSNFSNQRGTVNDQQKDIKSPGSTKKL